MRGSARVQPPHGHSPGPVITSPRSKPASTRHRPHKPFPSNLQGVPCAEVHAFRLPTVTPPPQSAPATGQNPQTPDTIHTNHTRPTSKVCRARKCTGSDSPRSLARPSQHQPPVKTRKHQAPSSCPGLPPAPEPVHSRARLAKTLHPHQPPTNPPPGEPGAAAPGPLPPTQKLHKLARWTALAPSRGLPTGSMVPLAAARRPNKRRRCMRHSGYGRRSSTGWWTGRLYTGGGWAVATTRASCLLCLGIHAE